MRGHGLYRGKQMAHVSIERKIYMKLTFPSTRSKIGSRIIVMMAIIKRFRMLKTRLRMFRQPFLDGRRSDRADAMSVYRDKLWYLTGVYVHWKRPAICLPSHGICLYYVVVFLSSKRMKIISCCLMEVYEADNVIKVSYISAFDSQGRCFKKKDHFLLPFTSSLDDGSRGIRSQLTRNESTTSAWPYLSFLCIQKETKYLVSYLNTRISFTNTQYLVK